MTANVNNQYTGNQPVQPAQTGVPVQPVQAPQPVQNQNPPVQSQGQQEKPNIWYKPLAQTEYGTVKEMGQVKTVLRFLPAFGANGVYRSLFEKDVSRSRYPNTPKWFTLVMVIDDPLHPHLNGFVGVMELSKTLHKKLTDTAKVPQNYDDINAGHNFNLIFEIVQSKDGTQEFPSYNYSKFEQNPTPVDMNTVVGKLNTLQIADFAEFVQKVNNPRQQQQNSYQQQGQVNPQVNAAPTVVGPQGQPPVNAAPPQTYAPTPQQQVQQVQQPAQPNLQQSQAPVPNQAPVPQQQQQFQPTQNTNDQDSFNEIFGTDDIPF